MNEQVQNAVTDIFTKLEKDMKATFVEKQRTEFEKSIKPCLSEKERDEYQRILMEG